MLGFEIPQTLCGVLVCLIGSTFTAFGLVLQKYSHEQNALSTTRKLYYRQGWWLLGFAVFILAQVVNLVAMGMAPQVVLSCLGAWSLVFNAIFAWLLLGEDLSITEGVIMAGVVASVVGVIITTPVADGQFRGNLEDMFTSFTSPGFLAMFAVSFLLLLGFFAMACTLPSLKPIAWATLAAALSGCSVTSFKCLSLLAIDPYPVRPSPWLQPQTYVIVVAAGIVGLCNVHAMNKGLRDGQALIVVPIYYALGMLAQILTGHVVFHELRGFTGALEVVEFWGSCMMVMACIFMLTRLKLAAEQELALTEVAANEKAPLLGPAHEHSDPMTAGSQVPRTRSPGVPLTPGWLQSTMTRARFRRSFSAESGASMCSLDSEAYPESFGEEPRMYTVSMMGPMGIA